VGRSTKGRALAVAVAAVLLVATRLPFLANTLVGEEGIFAALIVSPTPSSAVTANRLPGLMVGQVEGRLAYTIFEHQIVPYLLLEDGIGALARRAGAFEHGAAYRTAVVRGAYLLPFVVGMLGLLWLAAGPAGGRPSDAALPLAVGASVQPQVDGAVGGLLVGTAAFLLVATEGTRSARWARTAFPLAGALIGLGRHEWAMAFAAAGLGASLLAAVLRTGRAVLPLGFVVGIAAGVAVSFAASPADYMASFDVMKRVYAVPSDRLALLRRQLPYTAPVLVLGVLAAGLIASSLRRAVAERPGAVILAAGGIGIAAGFAASGWGGDGFPRYHAPALVALAYAIVALLRGAAWPRLARRLAAGIFAAGVLANAHWLYDSRARDVSITSGPGTDLAALRAQLAGSAAFARAERRIVLEHASLWLYYPDVDFIGRDMGPDGARQFLAANYPHLKDRPIVP
jgi:hypothetical protein